MPKITNPVKIKKIREGIRLGKTDKQILLDAGFSVSTANHKQTEILKVEKSRIAKELRAADITADFIAKRLNEDRDFARKKKDASTACRADELLGKMSAAFTDKTDNRTQLIVSQEEAEELQSIRGRVLGGNTPTS